MGYRIVSTLIIDGPIEGDLYLEGCTGITALPDNLQVGGYLYLRGTGITALPKSVDASRVIR